MPDVLFLPAQGDLRCRDRAVRAQRVVPWVGGPPARGALSKGDLEAQPLGAARAR